MAQKSGKGKRRRKHTITGRSLLYLVLMGFLMIVGASVAAGVSLFRADVGVYTSFAYSYANMLASNISAEDIDQFLEMEQSLAPGGVSDKTTLDELQNRIMADSDYIRVAALLQSSASFADLRHIYVVTPNEKDITYIWYMVHIDPKPGELTEREINDLRNSYNP